MNPHRNRALLVAAVMAVAALSQLAIIVAIGAMDYIGLWFISGAAVVLFGFLPVVRNGAQLIPWAVAVGCFSPGFAALEDGRRVLFVGVSGLLLWLATEVGVLARAQLAHERDSAMTRAAQPSAAPTSAAQPSAAPTSAAQTSAAPTGAGATAARLESLALVGLVALAAMFAAVLVALTEVGGGVMVAMLALAAAGAYRSVSTRLR